MQRYGSPNRIKNYELVRSELLVRGPYIMVKIFPSSVHGPNRPCRSVFVLISVATIFIRLPNKAVSKTT